MRNYGYVPQPIGIDQTWTRPIHVYLHLLSHEDERDRIMAEVCALDPGQPFSAMIHHPCLNYRLWVSTVDSDTRFVLHIEQCLGRDIRLLIEYHRQRRYDHIHPLLPQSSVKIILVLLKSLLAYPQ